MFKFPEYIFPPRYVTPWKSHPVRVTTKEEPDSTLRQSKLKIVFNDSTWFSWNTTVQPDESLVNPYRRFYKWYFTKDTPHYVMKHSGGEVMFLRANIKSFLVTEVFKGETD